MLYFVKGVHFHPVFMAMMSGAGYADIIETVERGTLLYGVFDDTG